jgi:hypothetical protein
MERLFFFCCMIYQFSFPFLISRTTASVWQGGRQEGTPTTHGARHSFPRRTRQAPTTTTIISILPNLHFTLHGLVISSVYPPMRKHHSRHTSRMQRYVRQDSSLPHSLVQNSLLIHPPIIKINPHPQAQAPRPRAFSPFTDPYFRPKRPSFSLFPIAYTTKTSVMFRSEVAG